MRLIDADALKERFKLRIDWLKKDVHDECSKGLFWGAETDVELIDDIPTVDAEPVKHGRWKGSGMGDYCCSLCSEEVSGYYYAYCPYCGAKMEVE